MNTTYDIIIVYMYITFEVQWILLMILSMCTCVLCLKYNGYYL